jgi:hypothetical protein
MERRGKCLCHNPVCSVLITGHGHARRSWTSDLGCSASTYSMASWTRRKRRSRPITTPHTTPGRPRAHTRTKVLLRHTLEVPPHGWVGWVGIDLHLGQKPKLGGGVRRWFTHLHIIFCRSYVYPYFTFSIVLVLIFTFPKHKKTKNISVVSPCLLFSLLPLVCFTCYFRFAIWKIQKYFAWLLFPFVLVSKIENPKIFVVLLRFCKVCCRVQSLVTPLELGIHFILFKPHKWKSNNDDIWQSEMW